MQDRVGRFIELETALEIEKKNRSERISLIASGMYCPKEVRTYSASIVSSVTAEGYPDRRYHPGSEACDLIERFTQAQAKLAFGSQYANVQPHSATTANQAVVLSLLAPGDCILSMDLQAGGHLSHGARPSFVGKHYKVVHYGLHNGGIDFEAVRKKALEHRPRLIICGASAYPRSIPFRKFREVADEVDAWLLADISHISGLVVAGLHENPIDIADVVTTSTYKQLLGPHAGIILSSSKDQSFLRKLDSAVFPGMQGTPDFGRIAAIGAALSITRSPYYNQLMQRIVTSAKLLSETFESLGLIQITRGTDNHMLLLDLTNHGITGEALENALLTLGLVANRNLIPDDPRSAAQTSGVRIGTNEIGYRRIDSNGVESLGRIVAQVVLSRADLTSAMKSEFQGTVRELCSTFPLEDDLPNTHV